MTYKEKLPYYQHVVLTIFPPCSSSLHPALSLSTLFLSLCAAKRKTDISNKNSIHLEWFSVHRPPCREFICNFSCLITVLIRCLVQRKGGYKDNIQLHRYVRVHVVYVHRGRVLAVTGPVICICIANWSITHQVVTPQNTWRTSDLKLRDTQVLLTVQSGSIQAGRHCNSQQQIFVLYV